MGAQREATAGSRAVADLRKACTNDRLQSGRFIMDELVPVILGAVLGAVIWRSTEGSGLCSAFSLYSPAASSPL